MFSSVLWLVTALMTNGLAIDPPADSMVVQRLLPSIRTPDDTLVLSNDDRGPDAPITRRQMRAFPLSSTLKGPHDVDVWSLKRWTGWQFVWPYVTTLRENGDTLTVNLLAWDNDLALEWLDVSLSDSCRTYITAVTFTYSPLGQQWGEPRISQPMSKDAFDRRYDRFQRQRDLPFPIAVPELP